MKTEEEFNYWEFMFHLGYDEEELLISKELEMEDFLCSFRASNSLKFRRTRHPFKFLEESQMLPSR
jgi:hypothetical protein